MCAFKRGSHSVGVWFGWREDSGWMLWDVPTLPAFTQPEGAKIWGDSHLDFCVGQDIKCRIPKNTSHTSVTLRHLFPPISHRPSYNQGLHVSSTTCKSVWCQDFTAWLGSGGVCVRHTVFPELDPHPLLSSQPYSFVAQSGILTMQRRKWYSTFPRFP